MISFLSCCICIRHSCRSKIIRRQIHINLKVSHYIFHCFILADFRLIIWENFKFQENNTLLGGLLCRQQKCTGIVIPKDCSILPQWQCVLCGRCTDHSKMSKYKEFALNAINLKMANSTIPEMISFLKDVAPKLCPQSNYVIIEAKLNIIWKMQKNRSEYSQDILQHKLKYCNEILEILSSLKAGECTLYTLLLEEIEETKKVLSN